MADPNPSSNRSQREMKFRGCRKRSQVQLGSEKKSPLPFDSVNLVNFRIPSFRHSVKIYFSHPSWRNASSNSGSLTENAGSHKPIRSRVQ